MGRETQAGSGAVPLSALGITSAPVASWSLAKLTGSAKWPDEVPDGYCPVPLADLTTAADAGTSATYAITADGQPTGAVLTMAVTGAAGPAIRTVANRADIHTRARPGRAGDGGKILGFQVGCDAAFANAGHQTTGGAADVAFFQLWNTHSGVITLAPMDPARPPRIGRMILASCDGIRVTGLDFGREMSAWPANGLDAGDHSNVQNIAALFCTTQGGGAFPPCRRITIEGNRFGATEGAQDDPTRWVNAITVVGTDEAGLAEDIVIRDNAIDYVKRGISVGDVDGYEISGNIAENGCSDLLGLSGVFRNGIERGNRPSKAWKNPADLRDHADLGQHGSINTRGDCGPVLIEQEQGDVNGGPAGAQGHPFINDIAAHGTGLGEELTTSTPENPQRVTGNLARDFTIRQVAYRGTHTNGCTLDAGTGYLVEMLTLMRGATPSGAETGSNPTIRAMDAVGRDSGLPYRAQGVIRRCVAHGFPNVPGLIVDAATCVTLPAIPATASDAEIVAALTPYLVDPGNPDIRIASTPLEGGLLMLPDGSYAGVRFPRRAGQLWGDWNNGSVWVP